MAIDASWRKIFADLDIASHDFDSSPFSLTSRQIKTACQNFKETGEKEPRILCKHDSREDRPSVFKERGLFILPKKNKEYYIVKGEGYVNFPDITTPIIDYHKQLPFELESSAIGDSEMQHIDYAYANSLIRTFMEDPTLVLTIRGRKYTPQFDFHVGKQTLNISSVQTEVDAGYEGIDSLVLIEAKNSRTTNTIIRQLYFPFRQWAAHTSKTVYPVFFEKRNVDGEELYYLWLYKFNDINDYNSIELVRAARYRIIP